MERIISLLVFVFSLSAFAQSNNPRALVSMAKRIVNQLTVEAQSLSGAQIQSIRSSLMSIRQVMNGTVLPPNPDPVLPPTPPTSLMRGECHIDDDPTFTPDQYVIIISGRSHLDLITKCARETERIHGMSGSSLVKNIQVTGDIPPTLFTADCHIDDDASFDPNQVVMDNITGRSTLDLVTTCQQLAQAFHPISNTSQPLSIQLPRVIPRGQVEFECHIDDDPSFDWNQIVLPVLAIDAINAGQTCRSLANLIHPPYSNSARVR